MISQRGWVELDLILSAFTDKHVGAFSNEELAELEKILDEENVVLYGCLVGTNGQLEVPPPHLQDSLLFQRLRQFACHEYPNLVASQLRKASGDS
ncbi:hypothetical protein cyc_00755 [Cyclospora cayetanensis]|uniref:Uncharacterized protein n=1 Tax=Cyclospora cayetanensis TaxID=88456 RepID=A0A1D3CV19_9EIME|nr:hypothetical protein cyc_00755 [Cyclospora cayetanensis]